ncbi:hypothetical protein PFISCL1PPCAC_20202, partial [Pristionchus fissidentatus]
SHLFVHICIKSGFRMKVTPMDFTSYNTDRGLDHFPLLNLPNELIDRVLSYLSLPLRSKCRLSKRLRDIEATGNVYIHAIRIFYCDDVVVLLMNEFESDEKRILETKEEITAVEDGLSLSILNASQRVVDSADFSYGFYFYSKDRIESLLRLLKRLAKNTTVFYFDLDVPLIPSLFDDFFEIVKGINIQKVNIQSTSEIPGLFDLLVVDPHFAVGFKMASKSHESRVFTDEFLIDFIKNKTHFHSSLLHAQITAFGIYKIYQAMRDPSCSLKSLSLFIKISHFQSISKSIGISEDEEGEKRRQQNIQVRCCQFP